MAESTLTDNLETIRRRMSLRAGFNPTWASLSSDEQQVITDCIASGLREFYYPQPLDSGLRAHNWSFLEPHALLDITPGDAITYDFGQGATVTYVSNAANVTVLSVSPSVSTPEMVGEYLFTVDQNNSQIQAFEIMSYSAGNLFHVADPIDTLNPAAAEDFAVADAGMTFDTGGDVDVDLVGLTAYPQWVGRIVSVFTGSATAATATVSAYTSGTEITIDTDIAGPAEGTYPYAIALNDFRLPDDFGGINGPMTFHGLTDAIYPPIEITSDYIVRRNRQYTASTVVYEHPSMAAIMPVTDSANGVQRWYLMLYPSPRRDFTLQFQYNVIPNTLPGSSPTTEYPHGGAIHSETVLLACLAAIEQYLDGEPGENTAKFQVRLAASVAHDLKMSTPEFFGRNTDRGRLYDGRRRHPPVTGLTYEDTLYGDE